MTPRLGGDEGLPLVIIGNPENRRVTLFQDALARRGHPFARVVRWLDLVRAEDPSQLLPDSPALVRIDSFGEDFAVFKELLRRGEDEASAAGVEVLSARAIDALEDDHGRILAPRQEHLGFLRVLASLEAGFRERPFLDLRASPSPETIRVLFDKRACVSLFERARVPFPAPLPVVDSPETLRAAMAAAGISRVFVKLTCGSSASCLGLYECDDSGRASFFTSMEIAAERLYNSLRPRLYREPAAIDRLLAYLLREGSHVEAHVPKARLGGRFFDTRMLVIDGDVRFTVVRKSQHPITNLHLGGQRGTMAELNEAIAPEVIGDAKASAARVFEMQHCLHLGVDVMFTADRTGHRVLEANAFGDLFPNLESEGLSVYDWEIRALERPR